MLLVTGEFRFPANHRAEADITMARMIAATRAEAGCIEYAFAEDVVESGLFRIFERWESRDALAAHFETPHMQAWQQDSACLGLTDLQVIASTISEEERL